MAYLVRQMFTQPWAEGRRREEGKKEERAGTETECLVLKSRCLFSHSGSNCDTAITTFAVSSYPGYLQFFLSLSVDYGHNNAA